MADRKLQVNLRSFCRFPVLVLAALAALLPLPTAALSGAPSQVEPPLIMPLRREVIPVYFAGKLVSFKTSYSGLVHVGWPRPTQLRVVFDTGSGHVVVPSVYCRAEACLKKALYSPSLSDTSSRLNIDGSTSFQQSYHTITIGYGKGEIRGNTHRDLLCLGPAPAHGAGNATGRDHCVPTGIVAAFNMSSNPFESFAFDGIIGLGLKGLAVSEPFSFLSSLASQEGRLSSGQFGVFLAEGDDEEESEIAFGGHNPARLLEPLTWVPLAKPEFGYWMVEVLGLYVDEVRLDACSEGPCTGILDTGTSHLGVPAEHLGTISKLLMRPAGDLSDCRQATAPTVTVELRGYNLTILPENYMRRLPLNSDVVMVEAEANRTGSANGTAANGTGAAGAPDLACTAKLMTVSLPSLGPDAFLLGEPALHRYYTVYDAKALRAGLGLAARHKRAAEPEEEEEEEEEEEQVNRDEIFLMQQMRGVHPARPKAA